MGGKDDCLHVCTRCEWDIRYLPTLIILKVFKNLTYLPMERAKRDIFTT